MRVSLRQATAPDISAVARILTDARREFLPYASSTRTAAELADWVEKRLIPSGGAILAEVDLAVVAVMHLETKEEASWIRQMAVQPSHVGKGIGSILLAHALVSLKRPIRLFTFQENLRARRFYERHGFVAIEFSDGRGNEEGVPDVLYELSLQTAKA